VDLPGHCGSCTNSANSRYSLEKYYSDGDNELLSTLATLRSSPSVLFPNTQVHENAYFPNLISRHSLRLCPDHGQPGS
jgi:hypothetical protein